MVGGAVEDTARRCTDSSLSTDGFGLLRKLALCQLWQPRVDPVQADGFHGDDEVCVALAWAAARYPRNRGTQRRNPSVSDQYARSRRRQLSSVFLGLVKERELHPPTLE